MKTISNLFLRNNIFELNVKVVSKNFRELPVTSSNCPFFKIVKFTVIQTDIKKKNLTSKKLVPATVGHFCSLFYLNYLSIIIVMIFIYSSIYCHIDKLVYQHITDKTKIVAKIKI